jgi:hypothetical protein
MIASSFTCSPYCSKEPTHPELGDERQIAWRIRLQLEN